MADVNMTNPWYRCCKCKPPQPFLSVILSVGLLWSLLRSPYSQLPYSAWPENEASFSLCQATHQSTVNLILAVNMSTMVMTFLVIS